MISIIMPVYNVEAYVGVAIESVLKQTVTDFELILVDDGSTDDSGHICDAYMQKDKRIRTIHKENGGLSSSRAVGLKAAGGKYIHFVDSDDWINENMLAALLEPFQVIADLDLTCSMIDNSSIFKGKLQGVYSVEDARYELLSRNISWSLCGKLYRKSLFEKFTVNEEISCGEDLLSNWKLMNNMRKVYCVQDNFYHYRIRMDSLTHNDNLKQRLTVLDVFNYIYKSAAENVRCQNIVREYAAKEYVSLMLQFCWQNRDAYRDSILFYERCMHELEIVKCSSIEKSKGYLLQKSVSESLNYVTVRIMNCVDEIEKFADECSDIYIYGAGAFARELAGILNDREIVFCGFVVTNKVNGEIKPDEIHLVRGISEIEYASQNVGIIMGLNKANMDEVFSTTDVLLNANCLVLQKYSDIFSTRIV